MQEKLATRFPRRYPVAGLAELNLQTPRLSLRPERNRINAVMAVEASGPALRRTYSGSMDVDFALRFEPSDQTVRATELEVLALQLEGLPTQASTLLAGLGPTLAQQALREVVLVPGSPPRPGAGRQPGPAARAHDRDAARPGDRTGPPAATLRPPTMSKEQARQSELKKMELCDSCAGIQRNWRRAPGHAELVQRGNRKEERGAHTVTITRYECDRCGTAWEYENDKANLHAGWSVVGR
jgi:hypothetical protein